MRTARSPGRGLTAERNKEDELSDRLTKEEIDDLAERWYRALDVHAPVEELHAMILDGADNEMDWPEGATHGHAEFTVWYEKVTRRFFDEVHTLKKVEPSIDGATASVEVVVNWQASVWEPPSPNSKLLHMDSFQTWEVMRSPGTGKAVIKRYVVDDFKELPDSDGGLGVDPRDVINAYYKSVNAGDWQTWLSLFQDDVVIDEQLAGHAEGLDSLRGAIDGMDKGYSKFQNVPKHIVCQGDEAAVHSHISAANASGEPIEAEVANYFKLRDGKVAYMANFHDTRPFDPFVHQKLE
jgi:ketosteroid isomerase-like protein